MSLGRGPLPALLLVLSCGGTESTLEIIHDPCQPLSVVPAEDTTPEERASVERGIALWNAFGRTQLMVDAPLGAEATVALRFKDAAGAFYGVYAADRGEVLINHRLSDDAARAITVAHELGHAMGLAHVEPDARASLMNPGNLVLPPTAEDERALMALWNDCAADPSAAR